MNNKMFKFGPAPITEFPPQKDTGPPVASILYPVFRAMEHRAKSIASPPNGYGSIVVPRRVTVDSEFSVMATLAANPFDPSDERQAVWWGGLTSEQRRTFPIEIVLESTKAFDVSQTSYKIDLAKVGRVVSLEFLVRPVVAGKHSLRMILRYPGTSQDAEYAWQIKVRSKLLAMAQAAGVVLGVILAAVSVVKLLF